ncbi:DUF7344 domain-containing protein [Halorubrum sp. DTA98]|uniref:DUF7344 domain-containing protein n=1 Tax=Halorubrum sp. DTA98 TaxID=3402163 RepID=UPI003AAA5815
MESLDEVFSLFSEERRRYVLYYLEQVDGKVSIDELVKQIHEWETQSSHDSVPPDEYEDIIISLEHNHLPKIEDATHIEFQRENQQICISGLSSESGVLLSVAKAIDQPTSSEDIALGDGP